MNANLGLTVVAFLLSATPLQAQWQNHGKPAPETPWLKQSGALGVQLAFTDKPEQLFADWEKPTEGVTISSTANAVRGVPIVAYVVFTGCKANAKGMCDASVKFTAFTPDGKQWGDPQDGEMWVDRPPPEQNALQLSVGNMGIVIDPDDPLGTYTVKAEVVDNVAKRKITLERKFTAIERAKE